MRLDDNRLVVGVSAGAALEGVVVVVWLDDGPNRLALRLETWAA